MKAMKSTWHTELAPIANNQLLTLLQSARPMQNCSLIRRFEKGHSLRFIFREKMPELSHYS